MQKVFRFEYAVPIIPPTSLARNGFHSCITVIFASIAHLRYDRQVIKPLLGDFSFYVRNCWQGYFQPKNCFY